MFCPSCGANNPDGVAFCGSCGKPMPMPEVPRKDTSASYCPRCGAKLDAGAIFCGECGQRLGNNGEPSPIPSRSPDGFPPEVINAELQKSNMTKEDAIDMAEDAFRYGIGSVYSVADYLDKMDVNATIKLGDQLDSDDIDSINGKISEYDIDDQVTAGYKLGADVTVTALDDLPALKKGETKSSDVASLGIYTIKIGNRWYLWMPQFNW